MNVLPNVIPEPFKYFTHTSTPGALQTPAGIGQDISLHLKSILILQNRITHLEKTLEPFGEGVLESSSLLFVSNFLFFWQNFPPF